MVLGGKRVKNKKIIISVFAVCAIIIALTACLVGMLGGSGGSTSALHATTSATTEAPVPSNAHEYGENGVCTGCGVISEDMLGFDTGYGEYCAVFAKEGVTYPSVLVIPESVGGLPVKLVAQKGFSA